MPQTKPQAQKQPSFFTKMPLIKLQEQKHPIDIYIANPALDLDCRNNKAGIIEREALMRFSARAHRELSEQPRYTNFIVQCRHDAACEVVGWINYMHAFPEEPLYMAISFRHTFEYAVRLYEACASAQAFDLVPDLRPPEPRAKVLEYINRDESLSEKDFLILDTYAGFDTELIMTAIGKEDENLNKKNNKGKDPAVEPNCGDGSHSTEDTGSKEDPSMDTSSWDDLSTDMKSLSLEEDDAAGDAIRRSQDTDEEL